jgi:hypothetical protein
MYFWPSHSPQPLLVPLLCGEGRETTEHGLTVTRYAGPQLIGKQSQQTNRFTQLSVRPVETNESIGSRPIPEVYVGWLR